ncbi:MAG: hypothetical protein Q9166_002029 [cf. Caloplaca sp. 2 TL-2023]
MTSNTTGIQWVPKPLNHSSAHVFQQPTRPLHPLSGTENHPYRFDVEPPSKKQRLDREPDRVPLPFGSHVQHKGISKPQSQLPDSPTSVQAYNASIHAVNQSTTTRPEETSAPSLVFPLRSISDQRHPLRYGNGTISQQAIPNLGPVQTKPFVLQPPPPAPQYPSGRTSGSSKATITQDLTQSSIGEDTADFSPWRGNHAEDVLSESTIKYGFSDKVQVSQNESSTAKPTAWNSFKHKSRLQVLSSLFVTVLEQRQTHGTVTAGCTFKPPPRVTLTDSKREAWLRDLANPTIPLRRLSRTIPHGVRGRALLDQSLAKTIPTSRSLWLAKCVGANEIRAFKRKGASGAFAVGGETKWIKDWTASVEQFLDALIGNCGSDSWTENMNYGLRLAINLFAERLLDKDHYFDWLLNAVNQSDLDKVPVYLLIIRSHLKELGQSRRYGRRLAESLLGQLRRVCHPDFDAECGRLMVQQIEQHASSDLYDAPRTEIVGIIKILMAASPASFLLPKRWSRYQSMLQSVIGAPHLALFENIRERNIRLQALAGSDPESEVATTQTLIQILDSMTPGVDIFKVASKMWEIAADTELLVRTCLCWSSSIYRTRCTRIYTAARLLRSWSELGVDVQSYILNFLTVDAKAAYLEKANLYRIISELIWSRHFSVGKYLNWLIANGLLRGHGKSAKELSPDLGLLLEIPLHGLSLHILNLRQNLLRIIGVSIDGENWKIAQKRVFFDRKFQDQPKGFRDLPDSSYLPLGQVRDTLAIKLNVGHWVRQKLLTYPDSGQAVFEKQRETIDHVARPPLHPLLDVSQLHTLLRQLEDVEDFTAMTEVLVYFSSSPDLQVLKAAAVTVSHYLDVFLAIGATDRIFARLMQQRTKLSDKSGYSVLIEALLDLAESLPDRSREVGILRQDSQKHESRLSVAACSPISEHMTEALQADNPRSSLPCTDDIEQLLASGTSMDKRLLMDVFGLIWKRFEMARVDSIQSSFAAAGLIARMRSFDVATVNEMTLHRVDEILASEPRPKLRRVWIPLICAQVISFEKLLGRISQQLQKVDDLDMQCELLAEAVECMIVGRQKAETSISHRYYRFYAQQQQALRHPSPSVVSLLRHALKYAHNTQDENPMNICKLLRKPEFLPMLRTVMDSNPQGWKSVKEIFSPILMMEAALQSLGNLVLPSIDGQEQVGKHGRLSTLLQTVAVLSLPLCRLYLEAMLIGMSKTSEEAVNDLVSVAMEILPISSIRRVELWASMISGLPQEQRKTIGDKAETEFFSLLASTSKPRMKDFSKQLKYLLLVVSAADNTVHDTVSATRIITQAHDTIVLLSASRLSPSTKKPSNEIEIHQMDVSEEPSDYEVLDALLRLLSIHQTAFSTPNISEDVITQLLILLSLLLVHPFPTTYAYLSNDIYDFLTVISDFIPPTIQARCIHILHHQHRLKDSRLHYVFAFSDATENTWLQLSTGKSSVRHPASHHFPIRRWETMQDATPLMTENDTSISLSLFGVKKSVL